MWDVRFWTLFALVFIITGVVIAIKRIRFIDVQLMIMIAAFALACDMLFCKQFELYYYIDIEFKGWYSFWVNLFVVPMWGLLFIKFVPKTINRLVVYISAWTVFSTLFEQFIVKPLGIVQYNEWKIVPYSTIGYLLLLIWIYAYYKLMLKHTKINGDL